jgi:hypothetical protein
MSTMVRRTLATSFAVLAALAFAAAPAVAEKAKSVQNEAEFVSFDEGTSTVVVKVLKKGKGNKKLMKEHKDVKKGAEITFNVIPTGSVLTRTSVAINGVKGEMTDLEAGKRILIYWTEDSKKAGELFARKIDVVLSEEELNKRYPDPDEE